PEETATPEETTAPDDTAAPEAPAAVVLTDEATGVSVSIEAEQLAEGIVPVLSVEVADVEIGGGGNRT
ncbi:MAG: hypothetical protein Q4C54_06170, partial [Clostridia bacterium]|nr:hypothetical protein [Clostridia bacterium]